MAHTSEPAPPPASPAAAEAADGRSRGWRIGRLAGVPIYLGRSWPIIAVVIVATFGPQLAYRRPDLGSTVYAIALGYALLLLVSVLAHEAAHALMALRFGHRVDRVVADLWGGHTAYQADDNTPGRSAAVAVVGPLANAALAAIAYLVWPLTEPGGIASLLVGAMLYANGFVALFNLLPGLPLDGGWLVDSLVWRITGNRTTGLLVAGWSGRVLTILVVLWWLVLPLAQGARPSLFTLLWAVLIGGFLWQGASASIRTAKVRRLVDTVRVRDVVRPAVIVPERTTVAQALETPAPGAFLLVAGPDGRPHSLITGAVADVPEHARATTPVSAAAMVLPDPAVAPGPDGGWLDGPVTELLSRMQSAGAGAIAVEVVPGQWGVVLEEDVVQAISVR